MLEEEPVVITHSVSEEGFPDLWSGAHRLTSAVHRMASSGFELMVHMDTLGTMTPAGLEPAIPDSVGRCLIHWATGPSVRFQNLKFTCVRQGLEHLTRR